MSATNSASLRSSVRIDPSPVPLGTHPPAPVNARPADAPARSEQPDLFDLRQLEVSYDREAATLWTFMRPQGRPSYNPGLLHDFHAWQDAICQRHANGTEALRYLVLGSRFPGVFNLGGDLDLFAGFIAPATARPGPLRPRLRLDPPQQHAAARAADRHRRARPGRRARRRLRGGALASTSSSPSAAPASACRRSPSACSPAWARTACCRARSGWPRPRR